MHDIRSVQHAHTKRIRSEPSRWAILFGLGFIGVKIIEYGEKIAAGINPTTNNFFMFYFSFTGIHLSHVTAGLGTLAFIRTRCNAPLAPNGIKAIEGCVLFWHLVDILWVILFAILYLHQ
ncbi:hypothetical protein DM806_20145 [Sphingobium lactosutens]|uniref:cytochrome c oxidase subunit 3 n=1 Tax=Sphingobium lactosutens TaxID=522773 RepID=UPI0015BB67DD|nr:cytochrome c oxidase subunit 3 [Sphingobium lactosutens]NWK97927.1 hypothetical protein [Sphingobium lactosutens]